MVLFPLGTAGLTDTAEGGKSTAVAVLVSPQTAERGNSSGRVPVGI